MALSRLEVAQAYTAPDTDTFFHCSDLLNGPIIGAYYRDGSQGTRGVEATPSKRRPSAPPASLGYVL